MADYTDLDALFTCPESITDEDLRALYEVLLRRYQVETAHVPLSTNQMIRIERVIRFTVLIKHAERRGYGALGGFAHAGVEKDINAHLQGLLKDVDDVLHKNRPPSPDLVEKTRAIDLFSEVMKTVPDADERMRLTRSLAAAVDRYWS